MIRLSVPLPAPKSLIELHYLHAEPLFARPIIDYELSSPVGRGDSADGSSPQWRSSSRGTYRARRFSSPTTSKHKSGGTTLRHHAIRFGEPRTDANTTRDRQITYNGP